MSEHDNAMEQATKIANSTEKLIEKMTKSPAKDIFDKISSSVNYLPELSFPKIDYSKIEIQTPEENNYYQSAGHLIKRLDVTIKQWKTKIPDNFEPSIFAILSNGLMIDVSSLTEESFHLIRIEGVIQNQDNQPTPCVLFTHQ